MLYRRDDLLKDLKQAVIEVTFTKVNGEKRVMRCTLDARFMPVMTEQQSRYLEEEHKKQENLDVIACWDIQKGGWRSFRIDSVEYCQELDGY